MRNSFFNKTKCIGALLVPIALGNFWLNPIRAKDIEGSNETPTSVPVSLKESNSTNPETYIVGPGDRFLVELINIPEFNGLVTVGPEGTIYLPRIRAVEVEGLTFEEVRMLLTEKFREFVIDPEIEIQPVQYRPIRVYVDGEVQRPGSYILTMNNALSLSGVSGDDNNRFSTITENLLRSDSYRISNEQNPVTQSTLLPYQFPTIFDAIRAAEGITPYSDLSKVTIKRKLPISQGPKLIKTELNFLQMITDGDESKNIRLLDGDVIKVAKSSEILLDQLLKAGKTNISPRSLVVFVGGRVEEPGAIQLPQGSALNQAILVAGGAKILRGKVEFVRFYKDGRFDRRLISYSPSSPLASRNNPVLMAGDIIRIKESPLTASFSVIEEVTRPAVGILSIYRLFGN